MNPLINQKGGATLVMAIMMLLITTGVTLYSSSLLKEQARLVADEYRDAQAYEAGMAGIHVGMAQLLNDIDDHAAASGAIGSAEYEVMFCKPVDNFLPSICEVPDDDKILIYSKGLSDDGEAVRHVTAIIYAAKLTQGAELDGALISKGMVTLGGSSLVSSGSSGDAILTGEDCTAGNKPACPSKNLEGTVVVDSALPNKDFFVEYLGVSQGSYDSTVEAYAATSGSASLESLWPIENKFYVTLFADLTWNNSVKSQHSDGETVWGSESDPVTIVIDARGPDGKSGTEDDHTVHINGNVKIYGLVYVLGNVDMGNGTPLVDGSLLADGTTKLSGNITVQTGDVSISGTSDSTTVSVMGGTLKDWL